MLVVDSLVFVGRSEVGGARRGRACLRMSRRGVQLGTWL